MPRCRSHRLAAALFALCAFAACRSPEVIDSAADAPAATSPAPTSPAPTSPGPSDDVVPEAASSALAPDLEDDVTAMIKGRLAAIDAEEAWPEGPPGPDEIVAIGACVRPAANEREALKARAMTWVTRKYRPRTPTDPYVEFGCVEADGSQVVNLHVTVAPTAQELEDPEVGLDQESGEVQTRFLWALRVTAGAVRPLFPVRAERLIDLDGDGVREAVGMEVTSDGGWELGGNPALFCEVVVSGPRGQRSVGTHHGMNSCELRVKRFVAADGTSTPVLALELDEPEPLFYRCFTAAGPWSDCPAAQALARRDRGRRWAQVPRLDRVGLAYGLELLGVEPAAREALVARAAPSTACETLEAAQARRKEPRDALLPDEVRASDDATGARVTAATLAGLGLKGCLAPVRGLTRQLEALSKRFSPGDQRPTSTRSRPHPPRLELSDVCRGPSGVSWVATWHLESETPVDSGAIRSLLLHAERGSPPRVLLEATAETPYYGDECRGCVPSPLITTKSHLAGDSIVGLVTRAGDQELHIVVDDRLLPVSAATAPKEVWYQLGEGYQSFHSDLVWSWLWREPDAAQIPLEAGPLLRVAAGEGVEQRVTFWVATPTGLAQAATFTTPKLGEGAQVVVEGTASAELRALLVGSERRGLEARDEAGCTEALDLMER